MQSIHFITHARIDDDDGEHPVMTTLAIDNKSSVIYASCRIYDNWLIFIQ